ncbi:MAG: hypothetical protein CMI52_04695 [Parcubacteria group bacterium]|mgnify:CR=1 FL=1|nr:hypothetical protein [Parcubacteria group bacterium]
MRKVMLLVVVFCASILSGCYSDGEIARAEHVQKLIPQAQHEACRKMGYSRAQWQKDNSTDGRDVGRVCFHCMTEDGVAHRMTPPKCSHPPMWSVPTSRALELEEVCLAFEQERQEK